ncbi:MFS transporter [Wenjunlia tyrosinilytica]|uniref:MFS transporter n=1 Tax=Wenjunlia tyrosinilytica TaxID=1544741 RepID=A0A917ZK34_9ACTN|nr:MFS transporter [Wenjunlia tyrosinilytica]GGO85289.1 MFS transporter [Wenjunlia tyrosinilytica]
MQGALRRVQLGNALGAFGNGFTVPFLFIYVSQVRHVGAGTAGAVFATFALAAFAVLPFVGRVIDRRGPRPVLVAGSVAAALGALNFGLATTAPQMMVAAVLIGVGMAVIQPALATMIVWCSTSATRSRAFATQFFLNNLGMGIGGLIGGLIVDTSSPAGFTLLFAIDSVMFLVLGAVVGTVRLPRTPRIDDALPQDSVPGGGLRVLLRDRAMVRLCVLGAVVFFTCYGQFESGLAAFATEVTHVSPATLGVALAANTSMIVIAQFLVLRLVERARRSRVIASVGVIWFVAWVVAGLSGLLASHVVATVALVSTYALFGLGEALLAPTVAPLVAELAPESMLGRYNSAFALVKQSALAVGPAFGGVLAGAGLYGTYIVSLVLCSLLIAVLGVRLGRHLSARQDSPPRPARAVEAVRPRSADVAKAA